MAANNKKCGVGVAYNAKVGGWFNYILLFTSYNYKCLLSLFIYYFSIYFFLQYI